MAHSGQELEAANGVRLRLVSIEDELLEMEARYPGDGQLPPEHLHPRQDEHFEVLEGNVRAVVDGEERIYEAGEAFDVPAGTPHQMAAESPARFRWEVRPALRTAEFFETLYGGHAGPDFLEEFSEEFRLTAG
jgi:quercetin dioxygenase-like cupin family protein